MYPDNTDLGLKGTTIDSKKPEYGPGTIYAGVPYSLGFELVGQSYSNFLTFPAPYQYFLLEPDMYYTAWANFQYFQIVNAGHFGYVLNGTYHLK